MHTLLMPQQKSTRAYILQKFLWINMIFENFKNVFTKFHPQAKICKCREANCSRIPIRIRALGRNNNN